MIVCRCHWTGSPGDWEHWQQLRRECFSGKSEMWKNSKMQHYATVLFKYCLILVMRSWSFCDIHNYQRVIYLYEFVRFACLGFGYFIFAILLPLQKKSGRQNGRRARWGRVRCGQNIGQKSQKWENRILPLVEGNIIDHDLILISWHIFLSGIWSRGEYVGAQRESWLSWAYKSFWG